MISVNKIKHFALIVWLLQINVIEIAVCSICWLIDLVNLVSCWIKIIRIVGLSNLVNVLIDWVFVFFDAFILVVVIHLRIRCGSLVHTLILFVDRSSCMLLTRLLSLNFSTYKTRNVSFLSVVYRHGGQRSYLKHIVLLIFFPVQVVNIVCYILFRFLFYYIYWRIFSCSTFYHLLNPKIKFGPERWLLVCLILIFAITLNWISVTFLFQDFTFFLAWIYWKRRFTTW